MKSILLLSVSLVLSCCVSAQDKYDYQWIFSLNTLIEPGIEGMIIDFNDGKREVIEVLTNKRIGLNNASICHPNGQLKYYTNGCEIYDSTYLVIDQGSNINPGDVHDAWCPDGEYPGNANVLFLQDPGDENGYYLIHKNLVTVNNNGAIDVTSPDLMTSYILSTENKVTDKNKLIDSTRLKISGYMEAILHKNGSDWWLIDYTEPVDGGYQLIFKINKDSISLYKEIPYQNSQTLISDCSAGGQACFSPDGTQYAKYCAYGGLDMFDFNRETAEFTNWRNLDVGLSDAGVSGLAISPNGRFAYISNATELWQVDLDEENLEDGLLMIGQYDGFVDPFPTNFAYMQIGPDCKIYMVSTNGVSSLHVINNPNEKGAACNFVQHGLELPYNYSPGSLPNFPVYRFDEADVCDPTITSIFNIPFEVSSHLDIYPNPTSDLLNINYPEDLNRGVFYIKDISGRRVETNVINYSGSLSLSVSDYKAGIYFVEIVSERRVYSSRFVKVD